MRKRKVLLHFILFNMLLGLIGLSMADAETITLQASYKKLEFAKQCDPAVVRHVKLQGPGEVTIHIRLNPYWNAGKMDNFPVRYGEYKDGRFQGWSLTPPFDPRWASGKTIQGGQVLSGRDPAEGVPVERISKYKMTARTYEFDVKLGPPCRLGGGFEQWPQSSEVVITATQKSQMTTTGEVVSDKPNSKGPLFEKPIYNNRRLDWCREWAKDCGKGAADAFCSLKGYSHAESWEMDADIGNITPTIIISTGQTCNERHCDGFKYIKCASTSSSSSSPNCMWDPFTNDQRQFANQPGGVLPMRRNYQPGNYLLHVGPAGNHGLDVPPRSWKTFGPYSLVAGSRYAAILYGIPIGIIWEKDSARLMSYPAPGKNAVLYVRNEILDQFYAVCLEPTQGGAVMPSLDGRWAAYRGVKKVADCSIVHDGSNLTFIMHRTPEERSPGRFISDHQVIAVAPTWGNKGTVSKDGRRIDWDNNSYWIKID